MKRSLLLLVLVFIIASCGSRKAAVKNNRKKDAGELVRSQSATAYIARFKTIAVAEMNQYGIPASITLAQGLLESGNGNSALAVEANNHFGIKCTTDWNGRTIRKDDDIRNDCFRVYKTPEESFRDHSEFLQRKRYAALFELNKDDYRGWAYGLKQAGYATNPRYPELLISLVERYSLHEYDQKETRIEKIEREDKVLTEIATQLPQEKVLVPAETPEALIIHEVVKGDTLYSISKRYGLGVDELKILNNIQADGIKLGQLLVVSK